MDLDDLTQRAATIDTAARNLAEAEEALRKRLEQVTGEEDDDDENGSAMVPAKPKPHAPAGAAAREVEPERELVGAGV